MNKKTNVEKISIFSEILFFSIYFATITRSHTPRGCTWLATCWRTAERRRCRETRMWLVLRFSCASGGWRTGDWIWRGDDAQGGNEGWAVYLGRRFSVFLPLAISPDAFLATRFQAHRFPRESRLSSHLSPVTLSSFLGGVPRESAVPQRGYILSLREIISSLY